jgi:NAD-dependent SIR2 family protein deacetylase
MKLQDTHYEDENGHMVGRAEVDCLGTYEYQIDGFFTWSCGKCGKEYPTRALSKINGTLWKCRECGAKSLLLRTDAQYFNNVMRAAEKRDGELDKSMRRALRHLGNAVAALAPD